MKQMLKIELERAFKGTGFKISILIGMVISVLQFVKCVVPAAMNPLYVLKGRTIEIPSNINNIWMAMNPNVYYELYIRLLPIIVVIPYAITYYTDNKKGIVKNYYSRTKKINYIIAKYTSSFSDWRGNCNNSAYNKPYGCICCITSNYCSYRFYAL